VPRLFCISKHFQPHFVYPGIYILAVPLKKYPPPVEWEFLSKLKSREKFEGGLMKKVKGGKEEERKVITHTL